MVCFSPFFPLASGVVDCFGGVADFARSMDFRSGERERERDLRCSTGGSSVASLFTDFPSGESASAAATRLRGGEFDDAREFERRTFDCFDSGDFCSTASVFALVSFDTDFDDDDEVDDELDELDDDDESLSESESLLEALELWSLSLIAEKNPNKSHMVSQILLTYIIRIVQQLPNARLPASLLILSPSNMFYRHLAGVLVQSVRIWLFVTRFTDDCLMRLKIVCEKSWFFRQILASALYLYCTKTDVWRCCWNTKTTAVWQMSM